MFGAFPCQSRSYEILLGAYALKLLQLWIKFSKINTLSVILLSQGTRYLFGLPGKIYMTATLENGAEDSSFVAIKNFVKSG
jgi:hypothetical protein